MENEVTICKTRLQREGMECLVGKVVVEARQGQRCCEVSPVLQSA